MSEVAPGQVPDHPEHQQTACIDGNEAAALVAHRLSDVCAIYPITPASSMGELADAWSAAGRENLWGAVPEVVEMQSEGGAAAALHGAVQKGALATSFTSSQGLLLMIPTMFKVGGELTPTVLHVAARSVATHALSIFGDHSDVMAVRSTGWAMLCASDVQEAHDFALVAHAATLRSRVPFLHFFDGFRTSHEVATIHLLDDDDLRAVVRESDVLAHRAYGLTPEAPVMRGSAQNPDVFFQSREAANEHYDAVPGIVAGIFAELGARTGREHHLVDYHGHPEADRVVVVMGSAVGTVRETVEELVRRGEKVGVAVVRLYRPFPADALRAALPATVTRIAVLDRTKEPGAPAEPLHLDVMSAFSGESGTTVIGGRYGLGSKEFTPGDAKAVFDELAAEHPRHRFTVGIVDDVTHLSLDHDDAFQVPTRAVQAMFFGLGSDGTVGANKTSIKLIGTNTDLQAQGYFVYDSKKSGSMTVSHLRFGPDPIRSTYLIDQADFVACHQFGLLSRVDVLAHARHGATVLLNSPYAADDVWPHLPACGAAPHHREGPRGLGGRRGRHRQGGRARPAHQHRHAAVLLRAGRRAAGRPCHRAGQGEHREVLRPSWFPGGRAQPPRHRPGAGQPAPGAGARRRAPCRAAARPRAPDERGRRPHRRSWRLAAGQRHERRRHVRDRHRRAREARAGRRAARSGTRRCASTAASARSSARTRRSA